ncbi:hypothetical protein LCGC14_1845820 [marine sediment metagenome]|uniref:Uncharacterized protein n=1 Tax=marine sediment metagenome TaxID=412755 RepID=A0A0F9GC66_9ZZZZ
MHSQTCYEREVLETICVGTTVSFPQPVDFSTVRNAMYNVGKAMGRRFTSYTADNEIHVTRVA